MNACEFERHTDGDILPLTEADIDAMHYKPGEPEGMLDGTIPWPRRRTIPWPRRRTITAKQRIIDVQLAKTPELSNRAIGRMLGVNDMTVAVARRAMVEA